MECRERENRMKTDEWKDNTWMKMNEYIGGYTDIRNEDRSG